MFFFRFVFSSNAHTACFMRPPCLIYLSTSDSLRELYVADFHKLGIYGSRRVWANAWDVFHHMPSRGGRGRRAGNILPASVGSAPTWSESLDDIQKNANLTLSCRLLERAQRASIARHTAVTIRHRIIDHHSRCPLTDPLPACCYRR